MHFRSTALGAVLAVSLASTAESQVAKPVFRRHPPPDTDPPVTSGSGVDLCFSSKLRGTAKGIVLGGAGGIAILLGGNQSATTAWLAGGVMVAGGVIGYALAADGQDCQHDHTTPVSKPVPQSMQNDSTGVKPRDNPTPPPPTLVPASLLPNDEGYWLPLPDARSMRSTAPALSLPSRSTAVTKT